MCQKQNVYKGYHFVFLLRFGQWSFIVELSNIKIYNQANILFNI